MHDLLKLALLSLASYGLVRCVQAAANARRWVDVPNARSSHKVAVPRVGGVGFVPVILIGVTVFWTPPVFLLGARNAFIGGAIVLFVVGLLDDILSLLTLFRLLIQIATVATAIYVVAGGALASVTGINLEWALLTLGIVGVVNVYNFMDGVDGIAGLQGFVSGAAWWIIATVSSSNGGSVTGIAVCGASLGFLFLNWSPAKIFMGDAGSTVLGYIFGMLPLVVWRESAGTLSLAQLVVCGCLSIWPFLFDGVFTIVRRACRGENILKAHRSHLYQRLVIVGVSHRNVAITYGLLGLIGSCFAIWIAIAGLRVSIVAVPACAILAAILWKQTVAREHAAVPAISSRG